MALRSHYPEVIMLAPPVLKILKAASFAALLPLLSACQASRAVYVSGEADGPKLFQVVREALTAEGLAQQQWDPDLLTAEFTGVRTGERVNTLLRHLGMGWNLDIRAYDEGKRRNNHRAVELRDRIIEALIRKGYRAQVGPY